MYSMIIVDDEYHIRAGLSKLDWGDMSIDVQGLYANGLEAYERISKGGIDIVLTDIRMPIMDGFELAQIINEEFYNISIVVLSGYGEFEYAKKFFAYNVAGYILKPVAITELFEVMSRVKQQIDKQREQVQEIERLRQRSAGMLKMSRRTFFKDLLEREMTDEEITEGCYCGEIAFNARRFAVAVFTFDEFLNREATTSICTLKVGIERILTNLLKKEDVGYFYVDDECKYIYLIMSGILDAEERGYIETILKKVKEALYSLKGIIKTTISCAVGSTQFIRESYVSASQARKTLQNKSQKNAILFYNDYEDIEQESENYKQNHLVKVALQYICENYNKSITLVEVAEHINVNSAYFSFLFKNVTNVNFVDYLTEYRIKKAKQFLKSIKYRVNEVSTLVGYDNPRYFSYVFKKHTGMTPLEYRNENSCEINGVLL